MKAILYLFLSCLLFSFSVEELEDPHIEEDIISVVLDFIPLVGNIKGLEEALLGLDLITGKNLTTAERFLSFIGAIPLGNSLKNGKHLKNSQKFFKAAERARKAGKLRNFINFSKAAARALKKAEKFEKLAKSGIKFAKLAKHFPTKEYLRKYLNLTEFKFLAKYKL